MRAAVGKHLAASHTQLIHDTVPQALVKIVVRIFLNFKIITFEEGKVFHPAFGFIEVCQNAHTATLGRLEYGVKKSRNAEVGEDSLFGIE